MHRYSIHEYGLMMSDAVRAGSYLQAMRASISPDSVVLDLGTGTGFLALAACRMGARRVFAIEPSASLLLARELAQQNGCSGRIDFFHSKSEDVNLPEPATVLIHDLRGTLPIDENQLSVLADARKRFLAPGARLIGSADTLWTAVVECPSLYKPYAPGDADLRLDLAAYRRRACNEFRKARFKPEDLLTAAACWARLDYALIEPGIVEGEIDSEVLRAGTAHGISVWFDAELAPGIGFSNAPEKPGTMYLSLFFPWLDSVSVDPGDRVSVTLRVVPSGSTQVWIWNSRVEGKSGTVKADFRQSTLFAAMIDPEQLHKAALEHRPALNRDGEVNRFILDLMNGDLTAGQIEERVRARFPQAFHTLNDARSHVSDLVQKYGR